MLPILVFIIKLNKNKTTYLRVRIKIENESQHFIIVNYFITSLGKITLCKEMPVGYRAIIFKNKLSSIKSTFTCRIK